MHALLAGAFHVTMHLLHSHVSHGACCSAGVRWMLTFGARILGRCLVWITNAHPGGLFSQSPLTRSNNS